ncbi:DUF1692-domain-containing protein [Dentipellis sp. KUC8613]|nr:DUF1692-domain-containing protein [Dentipellis sp. KUC8613]
MSASPTSEDSLLDKLDAIAPAPLNTFDAFPKLPASYKSRSESRGFFTLFVGLLALLLVLNDIGEFVWGWPDYEFSIDKDQNSYLTVNVDMVVNMPCRYLSVDLRDVVGDRLFLSKGFRRDGTLFDIGQATSLKEHAAALSARQAVSQSRKSRGLFSFWRSTDTYKPTYNHKPDGSACRIFGSLDVKKVTANLHITTLGHGYASHVHVPHDLMNMSHVITEFSFGPYFPEITQPLDNSFEITQDPFVAYQYFLRVVPTTYVPPHTSPEKGLLTNQYSVTHYTRVLEHNRGTPGIFFKFDVEPIRLIVWQRTTTLVALFIRCVGVIGGIFVCASWAVRVSSKAFSTIVPDEDDLEPPASANSTGLRSKWVGGHLRSRPSGSGKVLRQGNSWVVEGGSPYTSYAGTPTSAAPPYSPYSPFSATHSRSNSGAVPPPPMSARSVSGGSTGAGLGVGVSSPGPGTGTFPSGASLGSPFLGPNSPAATPSFAHFPPTPGRATFPLPGPPKSPVRPEKKDD